MVYLRALRPTALGGVVLALVVLAMTSPTVGRRASVEVKGKKYALLVGVDRYGKGTLLPGLGEFPRRDVEGMAEALIEAGYAKDDIIVMTLKAGAEDPDLLPNAEAIRNQLGLMLKPLIPGDSVIVMLVGHGVMMDITPKGGGKAVPTSVFCPMDANLARRDLAKFIALDEVFESLKECRATTKLLLVDACRNELKTAPPEARAPGIEMPAPPPPPASVAALYSCSEKEVSWQDSTLGGGHGVFSHFVIEGFKGGKADAENGNNNGEVTLDELTGYVRENVFQHVRTRHATSQMPRLLGDIGFVVLRDRPAIQAAPDVLTSRASGIKLKHIPAGTFFMGSSKDQDGQADDDEAPRHQVRIGRSFYLGTTEVTQGQYRAVTGDSPSDFKGADDLPVEFVSWLDAVKFCNALSAKEGLAPFYRIAGDEVTVPDWKGPGYRLPTEAEWEYACRAGSQSRYSFGDAAASLGEFAWFSGNSAQKTHPVAQKAANKFGLFDMHGNVWEWCWDGYEKYEAGAAVDPRGPPEASDRVIRGGSWHDGPPDARSAYRGWNAPGYRLSYLGFRVARVRSGS